MKVSILTVLLSNINDAKFEVGILDTCTHPNEVLERIEARLAFLTYLSEKHEEIKFSSLKFILTNIALVFNGKAGKATAITLLDITAKEAFESFPPGKSFEIDPDEIYNEMVESKRTFNSITLNA